ncbi:acyl-CoA thioesterase [Lutimaribacter sp. EGI FJ00015]|uniref:Acyl-CoA thioesterase n=1 Tax=Lutimaribacter degradans TaxID=2945989 RepID=A0ACC5ZY61_9RHOB|nr:thioesterase family protein [Lutimaribacter sp. EGI FJ00013]MCM2563284.1 acyl-CoA thioesterase [Lutimaribacter sp. EGI FJ00013]MCO0614393.1 acyl-CoA thioesterase [Lutimaribacter sp. EGI FJ00015]MCO0636006.1 acyl-CoA thioesterase [Lutimaribacter sp. EGI FJ00014]
MAFTYRQEVMFRHCDPARIVFYPRYFEMLNDVVESLFATIPGHTFADMHADRAVPTARIETEFLAPSRLGDVLEFTLSFPRVGRSSLHTRFVARCGEEIRLRASSVIVHVGTGLRPAPWPDDARAALVAHLEET